MIQAFIGCRKKVFAIVESFSLEKKDIGTKIKCARMRLGPAYDMPGPKTLAVILVDQEARERTTYPDCKLLTSIRPVMHGEKPNALVIASDVDLLCSTAPIIEKI